MEQVHGLWGETKQRGEDQKGDREVAKGGQRCELGRKRKRGRRARV